jgi:hypothetical protein
MVVMHCLAHKVACAGLHIEIHQSVGIEFLRLPQRADILVAELRRMAVMADVVQILLGALYVHVAGIPVAVHRDRLRSPVRPDAEFCIAEPVRALVFPQRFKACLEFLCHSCNSFSRFVFHAALPSGTPAFSTKAGMPCPAGSGMPENHFPQCCPRSDEPKNETFRFHQCTTVRLVCQWGNEILPEFFCQCPRWLGMFLYEAGPIGAQYPDEKTGDASCCGEASPVLTGGCQRL